MFNRMVKRHLIFGATTRTSLKSSEESTKLLLPGQEGQLQEL
jgi:hypothetical protein